MIRFVNARVAFVVVFAFFCGLLKSAEAQDPVLSRLYGSGVHAYFGGDYVRAHEFLTRAIKLGMEDPRVYYFRGLTYLKLGRPEEADEDFRKGAELEARDFGIFLDVGRALERVQGRARLVIEKHRFAARAAAKERADRLRRERYGVERAQERDLLLQQGSPALGAPTNPHPPTVSGVSGSEGRSVRQKATPEVGLSGSSSITSIPPGSAMPKEERPKGLGQTETKPEHESGSGTEEMPVRPGVVETEKPALPLTPQEETAGQESVIPGETSPAGQMPAGQMEDMQEGGGFPLPPPPFLEE